MATVGTGRLADKVTIITGATSGIGEATAQLFGREGATVVVSGRNESKGQAVVAAITDAGGTATFVAADVSDEEAIANLVDSAVEQFGRLDCLFSNAGASVPGSEVQTVDEASFDAGMRSLLGSVLFGIKHASRVMIAQGAGGSIINNSSIAAHRTGQGGYLYSVVKAGVSHATRFAANDLGPHGIRVNAISPGAIPTPIFFGGSSVAATLGDEENARKMAKLTTNLAGGTPLPRAGHVDDIAEAALFLASDAGSFINGQDLAVDGGRIQMFHEA